MQLWLNETGTFKIVCNANEVSALIELTLISNGTITFLLLLVITTLKTLFVQTTFLRNVIKYDVRNAHSNSAAITAQTSWLRVTLQFLALSNIGLWFGAIVWQGCIQTGKAIIGHICAYLLFLLRCDHEKYRIEFQRYLSTCHSLLAISCFFTISYACLSL